MYYKFTVRVQLLEMKRKCEEIALGRLEKKGSGRNLLSRNKIRYSLCKNITSVTH